MPKSKRNAVAFTLSGAKLYEKQTPEIQTYKISFLYVSFCFLTLPNRLLWK